MNLEEKKLCLNGPYADYVAKQVEEILNNYSIDGLLFDHIYQPLGCVCRFCMKDMKKLGLDPCNDEDLKRHGEMVCHRFMERMTKLIRKVSSGINIFFNSRLRLGMADEMKYYTHFEIECLPTGGWGYNYFPLHVRYFQTFGKLIVGHTARFHKSWGDFGGLKPLASLEYDCFNALANGARCGIGDQLHPRGQLNKTVYKRIGEVYKKVAQKEEWCKNAKPVVEIGIVVTKKIEGGLRGSIISEEGTMRSLLESHYQFQIIDPESDFSPYRLLIFPDERRFNSELSQKVRKYLKSGGKAIFSYQSGLNEKGERFALEEIGVKYLKEARYSPDYIRITNHSLSQGIDPLDYVVYEKGIEVKPLPGTEILAKVVHPYFDRTWEHFSYNQVPPDKVSRFPAVTKKGNLIYLASPLFRAYMIHGYPVYRKIIENAIRLLMPDKLVENTNTPVQAQITLFEQKSRFILHILYYAPQRLTKNIDLLEDLIPLHNLDFTVRVGKRPHAVYLAPQKDPLEFKYEGNKVHFCIAEMCGHQMVIIEI